MKSVGIFFILLSLVGCGLEVDTSNTNNIHEQQIDELRGKLSSIAGTYEGTLIRNEKNIRNQTVPVQITLSLLESLSGKGADGKPVSEIQLVGRFRRLDIAQSLDYKNFVSTFNESTGRLKLSYVENGASDVFGVAQSTTIDGVISGTSMAADIEVKNGSLGKLVLKKVSSSVLGLSQSQEVIEFSKRLQEQMSPLLGVYSTCIIGLNGEKLYPLRIQMHMGFKEQIPFLRAIINRPDFSEVGGLADREANISFNPEDNSVFMESANISGGGVQKPIFLFAQGSFEKGVLYLSQFTDAKGLVGNGEFVAERDKIINIGQCPKK